MSPNNSFASATTSHSAKTSRRKPVPCTWCGREVPPNPTGRHKKYCSQSCRQRAYEQRAKLKGTGIEEDSIVLRPSAVGVLHDQLFELRCAAEDITTAVTEGESAEVISELSQELLDLARKVENFRIN